MSSNIFTHYRVHNDHQIPILDPTVKNVNHNDVLKSLKINIVSLTENDIDFDLIGVDASIGNNNIIVN